MNNTQYDRLKKQMRQVSRIAREVIEEIEKESPNDILISDDVSEELLELVEDASKTISGEYLEFFCIDGHLASYR